MQAVREGGHPVWYVVARDEGHGFHKRANRDVFYGLMATFFAQYLDVPADPDPSAVKLNSIRWVARHPRGKERARSPRSVRF